MGKHSKPKDHSTRTKLAAVATLSATGAIPIIAAAPAEAAPTSTVWDRLANCESSGNFHNYDTGHNGHYGGFQFSIATWQSVGGTGNPASATPAEQLLRAKRLLARSGPGQWECKVGLTQGLGAAQGLTILGAGSASTPHTLDAGTDDRDPADVKVAATHHYVVKAGDTLSKIAASQLGAAAKWHVIYDANRTVIGSNPNLIFPGQRYTIPGGSSGGAVPPTSTPGATAKAASAIAWARTQLGKPYVFGATGPNAYDCSGFTQAAWRHAGVEIGRDTYAQNRQNRHVSLSTIQPGDLVLWYFSSSGQAAPNHVTMYTGGGKMIEASGHGRGVITSNLSGRGGTIISVVRPA